MLTDSWEVKGRPLFLSLLKHYAESGLKIKYIKFDCPLSNEKGEGNYPIQSERFDWKRDVTANDLLKTLSFDAVEEHTTILALDSLSPLLLHCSIKDIIAAVKEIASRSMSYFIKLHFINVNVRCSFSELSVIALLHGDVHEESDIMLLDYAFSCHLSVMKVNGKDACKGTLKRGGKVLDAVRFLESIS